jgi:nicotinate phosphoribosyltransferase
MIDLATRAHNHNYSMDPIVRSLMDTDFYKLLMGQFIYERHPLVNVEFKLTNRTKTVNLGKVIDEGELREQLDHVRTLRFQNNEIIWLAGNTFYGQERIFNKGFLDHLRHLQLPEYNLERDANGDYLLTFSGPWQDVTYWEIYALEIISELKTRSALKSLSKFELDIMYACAKEKLCRKLQELKKLDALNLTDFGTRRRHSFLWQEWAILAACEVLKEKFTGTSNAFMAMKHGLEAKGTNAHELPMTLAALANSDEELKQSQYEVLKQWQNVYSGNLLVALPDTFGTAQFLKDAPQWVSYWTGFRPDSKEPHVAADELIEFWQRMSVNPREKLILFSDGLDLENIVDLHNSYIDKVRVGFGWGTNFSNDFKGCHPRGEHSLDPLSLVCKVSQVNGRPAVKLSDNYVKATGPVDEVERYREVFGSEGMTNAPVFV